ncbi:MAG TPA: cupin domain-containing protein [Burkholderiales bacterium]|nr:cupin domain-containing protein [Burkholderiales bacterium]
MKRIPQAALLIALFAATAPAWSADTHHTVVAADAVKWGPAPPSLPPGAQAAALLGHPGKEGPFVLRLKFPAGFTVPPHRHSKDEFVTVIAGRFAVNHGEKLDRAPLKGLPAGSFVHLPAGMPHYAHAEVETIVQINGVGPFDVTYINPADDPRAQ